MILHVPHSLPEEKRFDIVMLALILLINMIEECEDNKKLLVFSNRFSNDKGKCLIVDISIKTYKYSFCFLKEKALDQ